jgi:hypothetical protein
VHESLHGSPKSWLVSALGVLPSYVLIDIDGVPNKPALRARGVTGTTALVVNLYCRSARRRLGTLMKFSNCDNGIGHFYMSLSKFGVHRACIFPSKVDACLLKPTNGEWIFIGGVFDKAQKLSRCLFNLVQLLVTSGGRCMFFGLSRKLVAAECQIQALNELFLP